MMRKLEIQNIVFASTGSIYGEAKTIPTTESSEFPIQTSLYGASKLACEGMIQAYCEGFGIKSWIFRFVSILGTRYTHGHIYDFMKQLKIDSNNLKVLGNGHQRKSYLHISDCMNGVLLGIEKSTDKINIFNLGIDETCEVNDSIYWICRELSLNPKITYESELRGWVGDNPLIHLDTSRIQRLGWKPKFSIENSIKDTVKYLKENDWLFN
jgi:UDP-glucose 4-epimerase